MKSITNRLTLLFAILLFTGISAMAQNSNLNTTTKKSAEMKTFMIERDIPNAGKLTPEQLKGISQTSCAVLKEMGPSIEWIHSYVSENRIVCIYKALNEDLIREHAKKGGFPANRITEIGTIISPATAE